MGLFQKTKSSEKSGDDFHNYVDNLLQDSKKISNEEIDEKFSVEAMALNNSYGIDQVIALMRDLPADTNNCNIVVSTVTKTLESANIDVFKIVDDARQKETALGVKINELNNEIDALKTQIAEKKEQINVSSAILEETKKVRELLENTKTDSSKARDKSAPHKKQSNVSPIKEDSVTEVDAVKMALEAQ